MEKSRSLSIAVRGLFVSAFFSTIFGVANASAYTVTYNANGALFDNGQETNEVIYDDSHSVTSGEEKNPYMNSPVTYELFWSTDTVGKKRVDPSSISSDTTLYAQYKNVVWNFGYTGGEQTFTLPYSKYIRYELWGAEGGKTDPTLVGGYGGYARGFASLSINTVVNIVNGEAGGTEDRYTYNGGGRTGANASAPTGSGGGATHVAFGSGVLADFVDHKDDVLIVAGAGGGSTANNTGLKTGGSGGGFEGGLGAGTRFGGRGGTQTAGGKLGNVGTLVDNRYGGFGLGGNPEAPTTSFRGGGGGAGWYGGAGGGFAGDAASNGGGGGGSGYVASVNIVDGVMYGYKNEIDDLAHGFSVPTNNEEGTRTYQTENCAPQAITGYAKQGDGYTTLSIIMPTITYKWGDNEESMDIVYREKASIDDIAQSRTAKVGYNFVWQLNGVDYDFDTPVTEDIELVGKYTPIAYNLTYDLNSGVLSELNPSTYTIESSDITLNNPTKDYYTFLGWSGTDLVGNRNKNVTIPKGSIGDRSYEANYTPIPYTITYNLDGGANNTSNPTAYTYESDDINIAAPTRDGYTFLGWSGTGIDGEDNLNVTIPVQSHGNREYTAHWSINEYTATFDANGGTAADPASITSNYGVAFGTLPTTSRTGYDFDGWFTEQTSGTKISDTTTMPAEDHTYYAHWTIQTFNITYDLNGGELAQGASNPDAYTYESADINLAKPSREGYTFLGWSGTDLTDNTEDVTIAHNSLGDRSYKAEFQINEYTATFDANAGETANPETITKNYDEELGNLPATSRLGYTFLGWFTDATTGDEITGATKMPAGDVTYYAHWEIITYTIEYDLGGEDMDAPPANDASNPTSYTVEDANITLKAAAPGDTWHYFVGWALDRDTEDSLSDNFVIDTAEAKNIKVYAIFQANPYTVTLNPDNGDDEIVKTVRGDQEIGELPTPERAGYEFLGWFVGDKQIDKHFHPRSDSIAVARWEEIPTVPDTGANSTPNTGDAIMNHIVTFAVCTFALLIVVALRKRKAKNEA